MLYTKFLALCPLFQEVTTPIANVMILDLSPRVGGIDISPKKLDIISYKTLLISLPLIQLLFYHL